MVHISWADHRDGGRVMITATRNYGDMLEIEDVRSRRMCMWIWGITRIDGEIINGTVYKTPLGFFMYDGRDMQFVLLNEVHNTLKHQERGMYHIGVVSVDRETNGYDTYNYSTYYIVLEHKDIHEDHIHACRLLDAAQNEVGNASIEGVGTRVGSHADVHYMIDASFIKDSEE
jgi:hypothetical protein